MEQPLFDRLKGIVTSAFYEVYNRDAYDWQVEVAVRIRQEIVKKNKVFEPYILVRLAGGGKLIAIILNTWTNNYNNALIS